MILSNEKINDISVEFLNRLYTDILQIEEINISDTSDIVIDSLITIVEKLESCDLFYDKITVIRQFVAKKLFEELEKYAPDKQSANYLIFSQKIEAFLFCYKLFLNINESDFEDKKIYIKIIKCKNSARKRHDFSYLPEVIVSLTSFPGRINKVYRALNSVFSQSFKPNKVIIWLAEEQFPEKEQELPDSLLEYVQLGLEIRWCKEDLRPHKKYYYVMQEYPKALIITVDDDLIYDDRMIEMLVTSYLHFPSAVSATRTHLMTMDENNCIAPYSQWINEFSGIIGKPSMQLFATSGAGTLYPPDCMDKELFNMENIKLLAPIADDLWFKVMQVRKGTPVVLSRPNKRLVCVPETQDVALYYRNMKLNDVQLRDIMNVYDPEGTLISKIFQDRYTAQSDIVGIDITVNNDFGTLYAVPVNMADSMRIVDEFRELEKTYANLKEHHKKQSEDYLKLKLKLKETELRLKTADSKLKKAEEKNTALCNEITGIKNSASFKIGRAITFIPRKIRGGIKCYCENGIKYTVKRFFEKIKNKKIG